MATDERKLSIEDGHAMAGFGVRMLTGEACRLGQRVLCDVTADAVRVLSDMLGAEVKPAAAWNGGDGIVGSAMIPYSLLDTYKAWLLIDAGATVVLMYDGRVVGFRPDESDDAGTVERRALAAGRNVQRIRVSTAQPGVGTRCTHAMSGRTA